MRVDVWSDIVCPWCYIGKRRLESALSRFEPEVEVTWHSFELDPSAPAHRPGDHAQQLADKLGRTREQAVQMLEDMTELAAQDGLEYHFDRLRSGNSFDAHRLLHFAHEQGRQDALKEGLFRATFTEGRSISDRDELVELGVEAGLDRDAVLKVLDSDDYAEAVRADEALGAQLGIRGVPFFVIDQKYGVSGAQPADVLHQALEQAWAEHAPLTLITPATDGPSCEGDACAI